MKSLKPLFIILLFSEFCFSQVTEVGDKVGIGTTNPISKLNVGGTLGQYLWSVGNGWGDFSVSNGVYGISLGVADGGSGAGTNTIWTKGGAEVLQVGNPTSGVIMQFSKNGNVGIGTTNPISTLNVGGNLGQYFWGVGNGWGDFSVSNGVYGISFGVADGGAGAGTSTIWTKGGAEILQIGNPTSGVIMQFSKNGEIGIGTTNPDAKLTVKGDIHTQEVKVDLNGAVAPDFVFERDYELLTLKETEKYIQANKHLPEIPSAQEMEKNGIELKEMNLKLLQKVEELTLHLIHQNKEIDKMKKEISALKRSR
ncbi:hypothetical protein FNH22_30755 [Fulvivirga sp. M361]|uniref:tail fiber protein n=1 Tax=Fulvivirga sp. M361 TaxID=2594266 RepID=UPI00117B8CB7|nr:tail fiber protein [Fulvivirga sp. M361]TRX46491.1 hypothetical protein FNH22_30755 [Fulvivirga sp. M361]